MDNHDQDWAKSYAAAHEKNKLLQETIEILTAEIERLKNELAASSKK